MANKFFKRYLFYGNYAVISLKIIEKLGRREWLAEVQIKQAASKCWGLETRT
jgi:hypothetical protein